MDKREKVYNKCSGECDICGCDLHLDKSNYNDNNYTQIDHIYPKSLGGSDKIDNLKIILIILTSINFNIIEVVNFKYILLSMLM